jgi:hypothetical protein
MVQPALGEQSFDIFSGVLFGGAHFEMTSGRKSKLFGLYGIWRLSDKRVFARDLISLIRQCCGHHTIKSVSSSRNLPSPDSTGFSVVALFPRTRFTITIFLFTLNPYPFIFY